MNVIAPKGWCPTVLAPMQSGDGLLVRIKPTAGVLSADAAAALAGAAQRYGNGHIDLTNRANLQLRGLKPDGVEPVAEIVLAHGLASADPLVEARRNVTADPLGPADPDAAVDSHATAAAIEAMLARETALSALPAKFAITIDAGVALPLNLGGDVVLRLVQSCTVDDVVEQARRLAYEALGARRKRANVTAAPPQLGAGKSFFLAGAPFGRIEAEQLAQLADFSLRHADGRLRLTPWRAIAFAGVRNASPLAGLGMIVSSDDPRVRIAACVGRPGCASAHVDTRADALQLAAAGIAAHVSGCAKGCAHPGAASVTLVGTSDGYALVRDGRASDEPVRSGMTLAQAIAEARP